MFLSNRHWQTEILVESLWWSFKDWTEPPAVPKKIHIWGTPIFLGTALIKIETSGDYETKVDMLFDTLKLEWCLDLADYILLARK